MSMMRDEEVLVRLEFVSLASEEYSNVAELCRQYGISRPTGYKWLKRYREHGLSGLYNRSHTPHNISRKLDSSIVTDVIKLRLEYPYWGPVKLQALLRQDGFPEEKIPSTASISRIFKRAGLAETKGRGRPRKSKINFSQRGERI